MEDRILIPLDGSETAERILPEVKRFHVRRPLEILLARIVVPAVPPGGGAAQTVVAPDPVLLDTSISEARTYLEGIAERIRDPGLVVKCESAVGPPAETILDLARDRGATQIAMATHGRSGVPRMVLGSVAETVLRKSPVPVLLTRSRWSYEILPTPTRREMPVDTVLFPVDNSRRALEPVQAAARVARDHAARIALLHVVPRRGSPVHPRRTEELTKSGAVVGFRLPDGAAQRLRKAEHLLRDLGVDAESYVAAGDPAGEILTASKDLKADVIVMGTRRRRGLSRLLRRSVSQAVLRYSAVPLLAVLPPSPNRTRKEGVLVGSSS